MYIYFFYFTATTFITKEPTMSSFVLVYTFFFCSASNNNYTLHIALEKWRFYCKLSGFFISLYIELCDAYPSFLVIIINLPYVISFDVFAGHCKTYRHLSSFCPSSHLIIRDKKLISDAVIILSSYRDCCYDVKVDSALRVTRTISKLHPARVLIILIDNLIYSYFAWNMNNII